MPNHTIKRELTFTMPLTVTVPAETDAEAVALVSAGTLEVAVEVRKAIGNYLTVAKVQNLLRAPEGSTTRV